MLPSNIIATLLRSAKSGREPDIPKFLHHPVCALCRVNIYGVSRVALVCPLWPFRGHPLPLDLSPNTSPLLQKWVMAAIPAFATPNTLYTILKKWILNCSKGCIQISICMFSMRLPCSACRRGRGVEIDLNVWDGFKVICCSHHKGNCFKFAIILFSPLNSNFISTHFFQQSRAEC